MLQKHMFYRKNINIQWTCTCICVIFAVRGAVMNMIVWLLDLPLPMESVPITTDILSSNTDQGEVYNIM